VQRNFFSSRSLAAEGESVGAEGDFIPEDIIPEDFIVEKTSC
jgi:hypothetical protein